MESNLIYIKLFKVSRNPKEKKKYLFPSYKLSITNKDNFLTEKIISKRDIFGSHIIQRKVGGMLRFFLMFCLKTSSMSLRLSCQSRMNCFLQKEMTSWLLFRM